jgi:hypothetical protein
MPPVDDNAFVHLIASVDLDQATGKIRYVLPSRMKTGSAASSVEGLGVDNVILVLKNAEGEEIGRISPELRFESCDDGDVHRRAMIQQDIEVSSTLSSIELRYRGETLDTFKPDLSPQEGALEGLAIGPPQPGAEHRRILEAAGVQARSGVSYMVQAKPDNGTSWQTISVGQPTPKFAIDRNQFPGARSLEVRVIQNAGFKKRTVSEKVIELD